MELNIRTKFNIGDTVYFFEGEYHLRVGVVYLVEGARLIRLSSQKDKNLIPEDVIRYMMYDRMAGKEVAQRREHELYASPKEAMDALMQKLCPSDIMSGTLTESEEFKASMDRDYPWLRGAIEEYKANE